MEGLGPSDKAKASSSITAEEENEDSNISVSAD